ncbi:hypothetical protein [Catenulispora pinisilvae]|nr:hypothetical protein [Catenulispora pinisilvae]
MNFASTYELAAAHARLAELHKQAADARLVRLAKKDRRRKGA